MAKRPKLTNDQITFIIKLMDSMATDRSNFESIWEEIGKYIVPFKDDVTSDLVPGSKKGHTIFDSTGVRSNTELASALHGFLTNPTEQWFGFQTGDEEVDSRDDVQKYFQTVALILMNTMNNSNFQTAIAETFEEIGSFCTAVMKVVEDDEFDIRFLTHPIRWYYIKENSKGIVDTIYHRFEMTVPQLIDEYGEENIPPELLDGYQRIADRKHEVRILIAPWKKYRLPKGKHGMGYVSIHILTNSSSRDNNRHVLKLDGYFENPFIVARWSKVPGEVYGRGPGFKALPEIKLLNKYRETRIENIQLRTTPPIQVPDDGVLLPVRIAPRAINFYRSGSKDRIDKIDLGGDMRADNEEVAELKQSIREAFLLDKLQIREADRMTAQETAIRRDENLRLLSPNLTRFNSELFRPMIERSYRVLERRGRFPEPPPILNGKDVKITYLSQIARAQKTARADSVTRTIQLIAPMLNAKPEMMDNFDGDEMSRYAASTFDLPHKILTDVEEVKKIRQARQKAQMEIAQQQQQMQQAEIINKTRGTDGQQQI